MALFFARLMFLGRLHLAVTLTQITTLIFAGRLHLAMTLTQTFAITMHGELHVELHAYFASVQHPVWIDTPVDFLAS